MLSAYTRVRPDPITAAFVQAICHHTMATPTHILEAYWSPAVRTRGAWIVRWTEATGKKLTTMAVHGDLGTHRERIHENAQIFDFTLSELDMAELDELDQTNGTDRALKRKWW